MGVNLIDPNEEIRKYVGGGANLSFPGNNNEGSVTTPPEDLVPYANLRVILPGRSVIVDDVADQVQKQAEIGFIVPNYLLKIKEKWVPHGLKQEGCQDS